MDYVINWGLFKHPINWLTVILMVMIAGAAFHFAKIHVCSEAVRANAS